MNEFELMLVHEDMLKQGIADYQVLPGNDCIWVTYGRISCYYFFRDGKISEVQFD